MVWEKKLLRCDSTKINCCASSARNDYCTRQYLREMKITAITATGRRKICLRSRWRRTKLLRVTATKRKINEWLLSGCDSTRRENCCASLTSSREKIACRIGRCQIMRFSLRKCSRKTLLQCQRAVAVNSSVQSPKPVSINDINVPLRDRKEHTGTAALVALIIWCHPRGVIKLYTDMYIIYNTELVLSN